MAVEHSVEVSDGARISLLEHSAQGKPRGVCLLGHALMVNRRTLDKPRGAGFASTLAANGFHTYMMDTRGHGESSAPTPWHFDTVVGSDLPVVLEALRERHPELPIIGIGHSIAGTAMLAFQGIGGSGAGDRLDALMTICATAWQPHVETALYRKGAKWFFAEGSYLFATPTGFFPMWLIRLLRLGYETVPREFIADARRWARSGDWASRDGLNYSDLIKHVDTPVLAVFASGEWVWCHPSTGRALHAGVADSQLETWCVSQEMLGFVPGHMDLVRDPRSRPFWEAAAEWVSRQCDRLAPDVRKALG